MNSITEQGQGAICERKSKYAVGDPCPYCGKPLALKQGRSILTLFRIRDWLVCEGAPRCDVVRLA